MTQLTIRNVDEDLADRVRRAANESGDSINGLLLKVLRHQFGSAGEETPERNDLSRFRKGWVEDPEAEAAMAEFEKWTTMTGDKVVLDTNAYSDWQRGIRWDRPVKLARIVWLPFIVVAELRSGFEAGTLAKKNALILDQFLTSDSVKILYPDETTLTLYAKIFSQLRNQGTPIPTNDLWIASLCAQHNLPLATTDHHFTNINQLVLIEDAT